MEECPPGADNASVEDDPSKSGNPSAIWTPNQTGDEAHVEAPGLSTDGEVPQPTSHSANLKTKLRTASLATSASQVLKKYEDEFFEVVDPKHNLLRLKRKNVITESLTSKIETANREDAQEILFEHMHHNADVATLREYCRMAKAADAFPKMQKLGEKMLNELTLEGTTSIGLAESSSDHSSDLETYKLDIVSCDLSVVTSKRNPQDAIKSLFFNAYSLLVHILGTCFSTIKAVAVDAIRMKQVAASREKVMEVTDVSSLFECLEIDKKWDDLHFLDVAISRLPPATKAAARMVLGHYKSHLSAFRKAVSIKEAEVVFGPFQRKPDRKDESVVTEITVDKEIDEYTCNDCLILWKEFLVAKLEIPEDSIQFSNARPGNSTTLLFTVPHSFSEGLEKKLSRPDVMWTMKELGILQIRVVGMLNVLVRKAIPSVTIREGLESGVNFIALTKFWSPLMCSLVDGVPEAKETQYSQIQPYSAASAELSVPEPVVQAWFSTGPLAQKYLKCVRGYYSEMSVTGEYPHVDYIPLRIIKSHPSQHKKEDTVQFLKNFQRVTVDFISQQDGGITSYDPPASGLLSHAHFLKKQEKPLHIVFSPPGTGKTSFSRHICSQFNSAPQSSSFSLVLLFYLREKRVAEAKTLSDLLSCYGLPDQKLDYDTLSQMITDSQGRGIQIIFDGLDERQDLLKDETSIVTRLLKGELKEAQIVVTSRPGIVTQLSTLWHRASLYEVQGFSHQEVKQYIESFFLKEENSSAAPELQSALADRPDLTGSTYIPLNLWLICSVFSFKNCTLPDTLTQCYTALFAQLLQRQAMKEGLETAVGDTLDTLPASMLVTLDCLSQLSYLCYLKEELVFDEEVVIRTCLSSRAELKGTFDGMSLLHVHPKKHGAKDHLTFNFLHSTYQEYLCARHILTAMSEEEQTAFWKENISNPRFAMVFRFYCGLSELKVRGVQEIVKGQELPSWCYDENRRLLFLFYALHESSNSHLTAAVVEQLHSELTFDLILSPYDFYVMQYCLSKTIHLKGIRFPGFKYQPSEFAIPCISTMASTNALTSLKLALSSFTLSDAQHLTAALVAVEDLDLELKESSIEAVEELLLIPTLRQLKLRVTSFNDLQTSPRPRSVSNVSKLHLILPPEGDAWLARCIPNCPQLEELKVFCDSEGAGDVVAAALPNLKCLRKVTVGDMNPVPVLQTVGLCGKLQEVTVNYPTMFGYPKHCEPTTEDWYKVSSSVANALHLQKMDLHLGHLGESDNFLQSILPCLASSQSLQELVVRCHASGAGDVVAAALPNLKCLRKVTVCGMNPVPVLQTVGVCVKLQEVSFWYPKHCEPTTEDWCKVSSSVANAQHLQKMDLHLDESDINFLQSILPCLASSQSLQELDVRCDTSAAGAGDVVAAALPNLKCLRKVTVCGMNPVPVLQTVGLCGKLQHVSVNYPKHCEPTTEDWCKVSSSVANAQHLQKMDLHLRESDINFLQSILPCLASSQSLQELVVWCDASGAGEVLADRLLSLRSVEKLHILDIDPAPVLSALSENAGHCTVSTLGVAFYNQPELCCVSLQGVGGSDMLGKCRSIRNFELYLNEGPKSLTALNCWMEGVRDSPSINNLSICCLDKGAGPAVAQLLPNVVGRLMKLSMSLLDPTNVLESLQDSSVASLTLVMSHLRPMTPPDQARLQALVAGVRSRKVSVIIKQELQFPYYPWITSDASCGLAETLCLCRGLSENPHIGAGEVSGVPTCLMSEVQCLLKTSSSHSVTVNGVTLRPVELCTAPKLEPPLTLEVPHLVHFPPWSFLQRGILRQVSDRKPPEKDQVPYELGVD